MELITENRIASKWHFGDQLVTLAAGKHFQIRTGLPIVELLDAQVPVGKTWSARITVHIEET